MTTKVVTIITNQRLNGTRIFTGLAIRSTIHFYKLMVF